MRFMLTTSNVDVQRQRSVPIKQAQRIERHHDLGSNPARALCRNHGCNSQACVLCKHNPAKRCTGNFAHKYWVGDKLLAKCEGSILVELIDTDTGDRVDDEVQGMRIEV